jgi:hypothetical protein
VSRRRYGFRLVGTEDNRMAVLRTCRIRQIAYQNCQPQGSLPSEYGQKSRWLRGMDWCRSAASLRDRAPRFSPTSVTRSDDDSNPCPPPNLLHNLAACRISRMNFVKRIDRRPPSFGDLWTNVGLPKIRRLSRRRIIDSRLSHHFCHRRLQPRRSRTTPTAFMTGPHR